MKYFYYTLLGLIQGFTEPIPISSSGHLMVFKKLLPLQYLNDFNFEIFVNFGSLVAVLFYYRKDLIKLIQDSYYYIKTRDSKYKEGFNYVIYLIIATIPAGILGFFLKAYLEKITNITTIGISFLITALLLFLIRNIKGKKENLNIKNSLFIGLFQAFALFPGISRSGSTLVAGMFCNLKKETAFKFSFLLYIPISIGTMILGVNDFVKTPNIAPLIMPYLLGTLVAGILTYYSLKWFKNVMLKGKLIYFSIYCFILALITLFII